MNYCDTFKYVWFTFLPTNVLCWFLFIIAPIWGMIDGSFESERGLFTAVFVVAGFFFIVPFVIWLETKLGIRSSGGENERVN